MVTGPPVVGEENYGSGSASKDAVQSHELHIGLHWMEVRNIRDQEWSMANGDLIFCLHKSRGKS